MTQPSKRTAFFGGSRVAFFGGSFDPPHLGHLGVARAARTALDLDVVLFAPVGAQPLKPHGATAPFEDRVAMTRLAIADEPGFELSLADAPQASRTPNFTLETLEMLRAELEQETQLFCLMGADSFLGLRKWHRAAEIPLVAPLIVASRPGQPLDEVKTALPEGLGLEAVNEQKKSGIEVCTFRVFDPSGNSSPFFLLPGLDIEISASAIRAQVRDAGRDSVTTAKLIPPAVAGYIWEHGLYR
jgi:nicotinate-nucleotide adenylyltransferase